MTGAADIYGQSMYELAVSEGLSEELLHELLAVRDIFRDNPDYITLLSEPSIPRATRVGLVDEALGKDVHEYVTSFIKVLLERGLLRSFYSCVKRYEDSYNKDHGIEEAVVVSAVKLSEAELTKLTARLSSMSGKKVKIREKVDPSILGGVRVELSGKLYDGSVQGRLSELRKRVTETVL